MTYSLLDGLTSVKADQDLDKNITEREWFSFAVGEVPRMQLEEMQRRNAEVARGDKNVSGRSDIVFLDGDNKKARPEDQSLQIPWVFYRRETETKPLIIAKP